MNRNFDENKYLSVEANNIDERLESIERSINKLAYTISSLEDALSHITRIPNLPLELEYDHATNTLWAETRRKLEFKKNEATLISLMFSKSTGKPKKKIFQCSEEAVKLKKAGEGIDTAQNVFDTAKRVQKKLDEFLNTHEAIIVTNKSFYFSKIALI
ncbi:hypothetical protein A2707_03960 [Candidatus Saccharibacteria bacterium RIFCSPHIGHO2_01_FULL_45_15]|nr:MAG: hypothetical protein A2707_03960 [Candidatus Saccharibacteria bacterium RIFCSPHIGHO2_01_FULL_45_15]OGL31572.1 MAG: hypothetical protein A3E76_02460 [Candidatus Saccharibacteria bacterium RIFCSPHIGHO2_12_FULL_44_22]